MSAVTLHVNGRSHTVDVADQAMPLVYVLTEELQLKGPKLGCGLAQCGACTVILDGVAVRSCVTAAASVDGAAITTLEGLGTVDEPHPMQQAFIDEQATQCGFCLNGIIMSAKALLDAEPGASDDRIRQALSGVLCRCFAHVRIMRAIRRYAREVSA